MNMFSWGGGDKQANNNNDRNVRIENYQAP